MIWLERAVPHSYIPPSPLISHPPPILKSMQKVVNWRLVEHGLEVTKHLRQPHLGTKGDMGWGCPLLRFYCRVRSRSYPGHCKVKAAIILNTNIFLQLPYVFCCKGVFHKAVVVIVWLGSLPTRTPGGTVTICGLEGYYPTLVLPVPSYITPCTSAKKSAK